MRDDPTGRPDGKERYEIRVRGHLEPRWGAWFDGMTLTRHDDGSTALHGTVADQSALHGLLRRLNDLGLPLVSVTLTVPDAPATDGHSGSGDAAAGPVRRRVPGVDRPEVPRCCHARQPRWPVPPWRSRAARR